MSSTGVLPFVRGIDLSRNDFQNVSDLLVFCVFISSLNNWISFCSEKFTFHESYESSLPISINFLWSFFDTQFRLCISVDLICLLVFVVVL